MPDDRFFEPEIETMPRASLVAWQEERILELVPYVYERSALVRKKWEEARVKPSDINSLADFTERVPFITKDDIRQFRADAGDPFGGLLCAGYADTTTVFSTSGTTGDATLYAHAWDRWHPFWQPPVTYGRSASGREITCWAAASRCAGRSIMRTRCAAPFR
jgi:phenylacetate-CoA ligase